MKANYINFIFLLVFILIGSSCNTNEKEQGAPKAFFDFDAITHVRILISDEAFRKLKAADTKNEREEKLLTILTAPLSDNLEECTLMNDIKTISKIEWSIDERFYNYIRDTLLVEKNCEDIAAGSCEPCYRDILIFKKKGETTGVAKFFFGCSMYEFCGAKGNVDCFGAYDEVKLLRRLLEKNIHK